MVVKVIDSPNNQAAKSALYCSMRNFEMLSIIDTAEKLEVLSLYLKIGFGELCDRTEAERYKLILIRFTYNLQNLFKILRVATYSRFTAQSKYKKIQLM
jgi:hypothetical protein